MYKKFCGPDDSSVLKTRDESTEASTHCKVFREGRDLDPREIRGRWGFLVKNHFELLSTTTCSRDTRRLLSNIFSLIILRVLTKSICFLLSFLR